MSDSDLRTLDRRARLTGSDEDLAAWLRVLLRVGDGPCGCYPVAIYRAPPGSTVAIATGETATQPSCRCAGTGLRLRPYAELCAYAGAPWAREALGGWCYPGNEWACDASARAGDGTHCTRCDPWLPEFVSGLSRWGREVQVRAAVAAVKGALPFWDAMRSEIREAANEGLRRVTDWLDGRDGTTHRIRSAHDGAGPFAAVPHGIRSVLSMALRAEAGEDVGRGSDLDSAIRWASRQFEEHMIAPKPGDPAVRSAISRSLVEWSLGVLRG